MSKRYTNLFSLPENLYSEGSPVVIAAGALLKDNESGKVLAQLKLKSIADKSIKAATVSITPYDTVGNPLGEPFTHQYLDLAVGRDGDFGAKTPILLPNPSTRSFSVCVNQVIFQDNSIWNYAGEPWDILSSQTHVSSLGDGELVKQFRLTYGTSSHYFPLEEKDIWHCSCSAINRASEPQCHTCQNSLGHLQALDLDRLREERDKRLEQEAQEAAERKAEAEVRKAAAAGKTKKAAKIGIIVALIVAVLAVPLFMLNEKRERSELIETYSGTFEYSDWYDLNSSFQEIDGDLYWICSDAGDGHPLGITFNSTGKTLDFFTEPTLVEDGHAVDTVEYDGHVCCYSVIFAEEEIQCVFEIDGEYAFSGYYSLIETP